MGKILAGLEECTLSSYRAMGGSYDRWQVIQYLVPGYISSLLEVAKEPDTKLNRVKINNLVRLLHCMVQFYEQSFLDWKQG